MSTQSLEEKTKLISYCLQKLYKQKDEKKVYILIQKAKNQSDIWKKISNPARMNYQECKTIYYKFIAPKVLQNDIQDETLSKRQILFQQLFKDQIILKKLINTDKINNSCLVTDFIQDFILKFNLNTVTIGKQTSQQLQFIGQRLVKVFSKEFSLVDTARGEKSSVLQVPNIETAEAYLLFLDNVITNNKLQ
ncbi:hypothetical protein SS50377_20212 [Spironucleus salmonicida]|uniref:Uncharacterized protein n=1 Tax=Spironucleus salmonicida TaxID=348837 RepID=V6LM24_9EUKA|nr:hypothetical protein SS50377_20212 [Spironucleus salmonicida]|eukprot:EST45268.1 Hypothetical protein SS50377_14844 [Spironucleus salmonicida]